VVLACAAGFGVLELLSRALWTSITPASGRMVIEVMVGERPVSTTVTSHPYLFYVNTPGLVRDGFVQHNSMGHRGPEISALPPSGTVRVLALGESTTYGWGVKDPRRAWPAQLGRILTRSAGRSVEVINAGLPAGTSAELLLHYMFRDRYLGASVVILHVGGNDVVPLLFENYRPDYSTLRRWASVLTLRPYERHLLRSYVVRVGYAWWLQGVDLGILLGQQSPDQVPPAVALERVHRTSPVGFERNIDLLIRTIVADGASVVLFPFYGASEKEFRQIKAPTAFIPQTLYPAVLLGVQKNVDVLYALARKHHVMLVELPRGSIPITEFLDCCHLTEKGEQVKADFLASRLVPTMSGQPAR